MIFSMACALHEETVAASSSMPPGKQSMGRSISPSTSTSASILDVGSAGTVAMGVGAGVDVGAVWSTVVVGMGIGVAVGVGVATTVGVEAGPESLPQATSAADARTIAITRQSPFFTSDPFETIDPSFV